MPPRVTVTHYCLHFPSPQDTIIDVMSFTFFFTDSSPFCIYLNLPKPSPKLLPLSALITYAILDTPSPPNLKVINAFFLFLFLYYYYNYFTYGHSTTLVCIIPEYRQSRPKPQIPKDCSTTFGWCSW